jgi:RNA polymerase sporulation-specific sigma factor
MYFLNGADKEDIHQEGLFGLFKAIRDFNPEGGAKFVAFASFCIKRQLISSVKNYNRNKHKPLNSYISLTKPTSEDDTYSSIDVAIPTTQNPENLLFAKETESTIFTKLKQDLSRFEFDVLTSFLQGNSYQEIADQVGKPAKSIDNAIQRIRKKVSKEEMLAS